MPGETFEEVSVGETQEVGRFSLTEADIVTFAEDNDPLPIHTDAEAAAESMFGGLIASGWQTALQSYRLVVEGFLTGAEFEVGRGVEQMYFRRPVRPGDTLTVEFEVVEKEPDQDAGRGLVKVEVRTRRDGVEVMTMRLLPLLSHE